MNRLFVMAGLVILIVALVFLNQGIKKAGLPDSDDAPPPTPPAAAAKTPAQPPPSAASSPAALPAEQSLGNPAAAKHHVQVGWSYTETNQQKPETLTRPLQAIGEYALHDPRISVEIVNVDVPAADRSPAARTVQGNGVFVDGKPVFSGDVSTAALPQILGAIQQATK